MRTDIYETTFIDKVEGTFYVIFFLHSVFVGHTPKQHPDELTWPSLRACGHTVDHMSNGRPLTKWVAFIRVAFYMDDTFYGTCLGHVYICLT